jgi:hypothetical protein
MQAVILLADSTSITAAGARCTLPLCDVILFLTFENRNQTLGAAFGGALPRFKKTGTTIAGVVFNVRRVCGDLPCSLLLLISDFLRRVVLSLVLIPVQLKALL